jgi:CheY-like chemotaxis protein
MQVGSNFLGETASQGWEKLDFSIKIRFHREVSAMNEKILLVGDDRNLLETRALILADWTTEIVDSRRALERLGSEIFDVVIVGQSAPRVTVTQLVHLSRQLVPSPSVLLLRFADEDEEFGVETHSAGLLHENPGWLKSRVGEMLAARHAAGNESTANQAVGSHRGRLPIPGGSRQ